jgi:hypothetical protein
MKERRGRDIFVVGFMVWDKLRRSGIVSEYIAPTELANFYCVVLQICRAYGAGEGNEFKVFLFPIVRISMFAKTNSAKFVVSIFSINSEKF